MKESGGSSRPDAPKKTTNADRDESKINRAPEPGESGPSFNHCKGLQRQWTSSVIASFSYFIIGTSLGWPSPVLKRISEYGDPESMTPLDQTLMVTMFYAGNVLVPIPCGWLSDWIGRKGSLLYLTSLPLASWIFIWVAKPVVVLYVGRFLMGMYSGLALTVLPMYLGEIAEPAVRGKLASILQLFTNAGVVFAYIVGPYVAYGTFALILGILPVVHFFLIFLIPESPYWYTFKGRDQKAAKCLAWLRGGELGHQDIDEEVNIILEAVHSDVQKPRHFKMLFMTKSYRKALIIVEVVSASQRFSGISSIMAYISISLPMMNDIGLTASVCAIIIGMSNVVGVIVALPLVDRLGRIPLMKISCIGCGLAMLSASVWYYINTSLEDAALKWMPVTLFCAYGLSMNIGLGPIPALMQGELFPSNVKGNASAITVMVLAASSVVVNFMYIPIANSAGRWCNFLIYALTCAACLAFTWIYAFETKGKTLREIQKRLNS